VTAALRTGQVAEAAGVNIQTLRYYERRGLLAQPARTLGGHRLYPPETVTALRMIKTAQRLGFSLDDVAELIEVGRRPHGRDRHHQRGLHDRTVAKLAEIEARIADLEAIRATLRAAADAGCDDLVACAANESCPLTAHSPGAGGCSCCP
jgi:MerR family mercuric resistance operon transcriptional regulator